MARPIFLASLCLCVSMVLPVSGDIRSSVVPGESNVASQPVVGGESSVTGESNVAPKPVVGREPSVTGESNVAPQPGVGGEPSATAESNVAQPVVPGPAATETLPGAKSPAAIEALPGTKIKELETLVKGMKPDTEALHNAVTGEHGENKLVLATEEWAQQAKDVYAKASDLRAHAMKMLDKVLSAHVLLSMQAKGIHIDIAKGSTKPTEVNDYYKVKVAHLKELGHQYYNPDATQSHAASVSSTALESHRANMYSESDPSGRSKPEAMLPAGKPPAST